jgi:hypothetical protein
VMSSQLIAFDPSQPGGGSLNSEFLRSEILMVIFRRASRTLTWSFCSAWHLLPTVLVRMGLVFWAGGGLRQPSVPAEPAARFLGWLRDERLSLLPLSQPGKSREQGRSETNDTRRASLARLGSRVVATLRLELGMRGEKLQASEAPPSVVLTAPQTPGAL